MKIIFLWVIIAFIAGFLGAGKYILKSDFSILLFLAFILAPGFILADNSGYGEIIGIIYAPVIGILMVILFAAGHTFRYTLSLKIIYVLQVIEKYNELLRENSPQRTRLLKLAKTTVKKISICVIILGIVVSCIACIKNKPYRDLKNHIEEKTLTEDMCDWENVYYDIIQNSKGHKIIVDTLTKYKKQNDIESALWLLSVLPLTATENNIPDSIGMWILDYAKENGVQTSNKSDDEYYRVTYFELENYYVFVPTQGKYLNKNSLRTVPNTGQGYGKTTYDDIDTNSNLSGPIFPKYDVPYYGMDEDQINNTNLGHYDQKELCRDYLALDYDHRSITYYWYDENGNKIFSAYALAGEVISTTDRRGAKIKTDSASNH